MKAVLIVVTLMAQLLATTLPAAASAARVGASARPAADDPYPSLLEGVVFVDVDRNGYANYEEPQLLDVAVVLSGTDDLGQSVVSVCVFKLLRSASSRPADYYWQSDGPFLPPNSRSCLSCHGVLDSQFDFRCFHADLEGFL